MPNQTRSRSIPNRNRGNQNPNQRAPQNNTPQKNVDDSWMHRGKEGMEVSHREVAQAAAKKKERQERGYAPRRFSVPLNSTKKIVILDNSQMDLKFAYEHSFFNESTRSYDGDPEMCVKEFDTCPACAGEISDHASPPYYALFLSVIDMTPWTKKGKDGKPDVVIPFQRKLMMIKAGQHEKFLNIFREAEAKYGRLRGVALKLSRGSEQNSPSTGEPVIIHDGRQFASYNEKTLMNKFSHPPLTKKDGTVYLEENGQTKPFVYGQIFTKPNANEMRVRWGVEPIEGNKNSEVYGESNDFDSDFDGGGDANQDKVYADANGYTNDDFDSDDFDSDEDDLGTDEDIPFEKNDVVQQEDDNDDFDG